MYKSPRENARDMCREIDELKQIIKEKEQEHEEWKKEFDKTHQLMLEKQKELVKEILKNDQLKIENEKLKQYKDSKQASYETMQREWNDAKNEVKQLKAENKNIVLCYKNNLLVLNHEELVNNKLTNRCLKLEQTLQEIKEVIKQEGYINKKTQMFKGSVLYQAMEDLKLPDRKILKIINEVLND